jgi:hypothetical protein
MMNAETASDTREDAVSSWTCARCEMTVSFAPEVKRPRLPSTWARENGELYCLNCRRELAAEAEIEEAGDDVSTERRTQIRARARVEFEIKRDPGRQDSAIAKACRSSTFSVRKARARLAGDPEDSA